MVGSGIRKKPIPDPGSRGPKGTGSRIRIRNTGRRTFFLSSLDFCGLHIFLCVKLYSDPFGSGSESERFDRIRIRILQNIRILSDSDSDSDSDPQHCYHPRVVPNTYNPLIHGRGADLPPISLLGKNSKSA